MKKIFFGFVAILILAVLLIFAILQIKAPEYSGNLSLNGIEKETIIRFDPYGIPHIYASTEEDAYFALGYAQAQERLFQMEMLRRVSSGRLSEVLGQDFLETDKLFRTLGIEKKAQELAANFMASSSVHKNAALAYFEGINSFVENGPTPIEFTLMGIPKKEFGIIDAYRTTGFVALGFAEGFKVDPITSKILALYGPGYLSDLGVHSINDSTFIPSYNPKNINSVSDIFNRLPLPPIIGSNSWIVGSERSSNGKPVFENDTHIGFSQPAVWFEAHLEYPGHSYYGHYLSALPFGLLGHNRFSALGLTMFENDDVDFFAETFVGADSSLYLFNDTARSINSRIEVINVKNEEPFELTVRETHHGPIIDEFYFEENVSRKPLSVWWAFLHVKRDFLKSIYELNHSSSLVETQQAVASIEAPGLNVMYADESGNIAWWAAAKLPIRREHVDSKLVLDGSGPDEYLGFYDFENNPQAVNPPWNFVYSANNQPDTVNGVLFPGYYMPMDRGRKIEGVLTSAENWTVSDSEELSLDVTSTTLKELSQIILEISQGSVDMENSPISYLKDWDGSCNAESHQASIYYTYLSWILFYAMADELGFKDWQAFITSSLMKRSYALFLQNEQSSWWDDISTDQLENRDHIITKAHERTVTTLKSNFDSKDPTEWHWKYIHQLTHNHPLGSVKIFEPFFNVGPFAMAGGNETVNNQMFNLDTTGIFNIKGGPSMRTIIDLSDLNSAISVSPTGQSGNVMSPHYQDQSLMYANGMFRPQLMDSIQIVQNMKSELRLKPKNDD